MKAKEMFEKLDYKQIEVHVEKIEYYYYIDIDGYERIEKSTIFNKKERRIELDQSDFYEQYDILTLEELQAINKQVEELGWNNE